MDLSTERCLIRKLTLADADELYQTLSDEQVMAYVEPAFDLEKTKRFIQEAGLCDPPLVYALVWKASGRVIGHVIFHLYEENSYEIGWVIHRKYWGMGVADELTRKLIEQAKNRNADSCVIECCTEQIASQRIAIRNGFCHEDTTGQLKRYRLLLL